MEHVTTLVSTQRVVAPSGAGDRTGPSTRPPAAAGSVEAAAQQPTNMNMSPNKLMTSVYDMRTFYSWSRTNKQFVSTR